MRIFALELNNEIKGITERKAYIEALIAALSSPELVVLPELSMCSYMASQEMWRYADDCGRDTGCWAVSMAKKYNTYVAAGYLDRENGDFFNRYLIAGKDGVCGSVTKCEGESAVFKRGNFGSIINTPFGNVAVAICYDAKRKHFYENIQNREIALILFPHGCPADPKKPEEEIRTNDYMCGSYEKAFGVPVVYVNCVGELEYMPGKMGELMSKAGFRMNGRTKIYAESAEEIPCDVSEAVAVNAELCTQTRKSDISFYGDNLIKGNWIFREFVLKPDTENGIRLYEAEKNNWRGDELEHRD